MWLTGSIQIDRSGTKINPVEAGVLQLGYLAVLVGLWRLVTTLIRLARRQTEPGTSRLKLRPRAGGSLAFIAGAAVFTGGLYLIGGDIAALWCVDLLRPLSIAAGVLLVTAAIQQLGPTAPQSGPVDTPPGPANVIT
jgi:hypothetical protein